MNKGEKVILLKKKSNTDIGESLLKDHSHNTRAYILFLPVFLGYESGGEKTRNYKAMKEMWRGFPGGDSGKEPACQCRRCKRCGFDPRVEKIPWGRAWQPSSSLTWRIPRTEEPGRLWSLGWSGLAHTQEGAWNLRPFPVLTFVSYNPFSLSYCPVARTLPPGSVYSAHRPTLAILGQCVWKCQDVLKNHGDGTVIYWLKINILIKINIG